MRVIAGKAKGTRLQAVPGSTTRPILDRVKTSLFDILRPELSEMHVLDLFAGSGSVGIEALSQGASFCTFTDIEKKAVETTYKNLELTHLRESSEVRRLDAFRFLRNCKSSFDLIYIDPPQFRSLWVEAMQHIAERPDLLNQQGLVIVKIHPKEYEELSLMNFSEERKERYGNTLILFYRKS